MSWSTPSGFAPTQLGIERTGGGYRRAIAPPLFTEEELAALLKLPRAEFIAAVFARYDERFGPIKEPTA